MVTIKDIATKAGVSPSVVSRALNKRYGVKEETRLKIERIAREMGYYPNVLARSLVTQRTDTIGVVMADISEPYYSQIIKGMDSVAVRTGHTLLFSNSFENLEESQILPKMLGAERVDAVVVVGSNIAENEYVTSLLGQRTPAVLIERNLSDPQMNCIWVDNVAGGYLATRHLLDRGHRRIAHISGPPGFQVSLDRVEGYRKALEEYGIKSSEELVIIGNFMWQSGYSAMQDLLKRQSGCTAVFAGNDSMAYGVLQAIAEAGLSVPGDIAVVGYDDLAFSLLTNPPLTTIRQPLYEMGKKAIEVLASALNQDDYQGGVKIKLRPELVVRRST